MAKYCPANKYNHALEVAKNDPEEGLELLNDLVKKYPSDPSVRHALGMTLLQLDHNAQALPHLEHAAAREDRGSDTLGNVQFALALTYGGLGMEMHARRAAKKARDLGMTDVPDMGEFSTKDLQGDVPESMNEKDMLLFEQARYKVLYGQHKQGITDMKAFLKRFPSYMPARNIVTTGYFVTGDLANYRSMVEETLQVAPKNIHTLVNAVRLTLLTEGPQAAQTWREPIAKAMVRKEEGVVQGLLAQLQAFGFLGDDEGVATTLESITQEEEEDDLTDHFAEVLAERQNGTPRPYQRLQDLMMGWLKRWQSMAHTKHLGRIIKTDLETLPGFLQLLPSYLGYEDKPIARLFVAFLLEQPDLPTPLGAWPEVLKKIATEGPGLQETRTDLLLFLLQKGIVSDEETVAFEGTPEGVKLMQLELYTEAEESPLSRTDREKLGDILEQMRSGEMGKARVALEDMATKYPEDTSLLYNLALAEAHDKSLPKGKERSRARLEHLVERFPEYLFAKAQLAREAIKEDNVARAQDLLKLPEGVKRFHLDAYAAFIAAQGELQFAQGEVERAEEILGMLEEMVGDDHSSYRILEQAMLPDLEMGMLEKLLKPGFGRKRRGDDRRKT